MMSIERGRMTDISNLVVFRNRLDVFVSVYHSMLVMTWGSKFLSCTSTLFLDRVSQNKIFSMIKMCNTLEDLNIFGYRYWYICSADKSLFLSLELPYKYVNNLFL
jgi:hypothetical protein